MFTLKNSASSVLAMSAILMTTHAFAMPGTEDEDIKNPAAVKRSNETNPNTSIFSITEETKGKLPEKLRDKFNVGDKVAVLAGTTTTGFGSLGAGFTSINDDSETQAKIGLGNRVADDLRGHIKADFNKPEELDPSLTHLFDIVIIEGPGAQNKWNTKMFASAVKMLKPGGRLDVTVYEASLATSTIEPIPFTFCRANDPHADFSKYNSWRNGPAYELLETRMKEMSQELGSTDEKLLTEKFGLNLYTRYITQHCPNLKPVTLSSKSVVEKMSKKIQDDSGIRNKVRCYLDDNTNCGFGVPDLWEQPHNLTFATQPHGYISFTKE